MHDICQKSDILTEKEGNWMERKGNLGVSFVHPTNPRFTQVGLSLLATSRTFHFGLKQTAFIPHSRENVIEYIRMLGVITVGP